MAQLKKKPVLSHRTVTIVCELCGWEDSELCSRCNHGPPNNWFCGSCGYERDGIAGVCDVCEVPPIAAPVPVNPTTWTCESCGWNSNFKGSVVCDLCDETPSSPLADSIPAPAESATDSKLSLNEKKSNQESVLHSFVPPAVQPLVCPGNWQWRDNGDVWVAYDRVLCTQLDAARLSQPLLTFQVHHRGQYEVNFVAMKQRNVVTGFERDVRCLVTTAQRPVLPPPPSVAPPDVAPPSPQIPPHAAVPAVAPPPSPPVPPPTVVPAVAVTPAVGNIVWQWKDVGGVWKSYDDSVSSALEVEWLKRSDRKKVAVDVPNVSHQYEVDVVRMKQRNSDTGYERDVRRVARAAAAAATQAVVDGGKLATTTATTNSGVIWQWPADDGFWKSFGPDVCSRLEVAWRGTRDAIVPVLLPDGSHDYEVDVATRQRRHVRTGSRRSVRRLVTFVPQKPRPTPAPKPVPVPVPVPVHPGGGGGDVPNPWTVWSDDHSTQQERVVVDPASQEYSYVKSKVTERTVGRMGELVVERIQNRDMWENYSLKRRQLRKREGDGSPEERQLFHGTSGEGIVDGILTNGFDFRTCGRNATVYGRGSYFAVDASYSLGYSDRHAATGDKGYMFMAKVLVGRYTEGSYNLTRPPPLDPSQPNKLLFDSCVDSESSPSMFVTFDRAVSYPEYLLTYTVD